MKKILMFLLGGSMCLSVAQAEDEAVGKGKPKGLEARRAEMMKRYDKNSDGILDDAEREAMRDEQKKKRESDRLKKYDKNGDGQLDDAEKDTMREDMKKAREARGVVKGKPGDKPPAPPVPPAPPKEASKN